MASSRKPAPHSVQIAIGDKRHWTKPEGNTREHWRVVHARGEAQKALVWGVLCCMEPPQLPAVITLTRLSSGRAMDTDNLSSALKRVRDTVARWCGCGDSPGDPLTWEYAQEPCARRMHAVRIEWRTV